MTFKEARIKAGYTQEEFARRTAISISSIRNIEQNLSKLGDVSWLYGERIRRALHLDPDTYFILVMNQWDDWSKKRYSVPSDIE